MNESKPEPPTTDALQNGTLAVDAMNKQNLAKKPEPEPTAHERREARRTSLKSDAAEEPTCHRRVSVSGRTTPKKKNECGTHVVSKSELWDTGSQHRCPKSHQSKARVSVDDETVMHRSVSERNRHLQRRERPPARKEQQCNSKPGHFQSTPNVNALKSAVPDAPKRAQEKQMCNAASESELLDREILPIFQKLLTERNKGQRNIDYAFGRSCPNISIKCDIVEYL